MKKILTFLDKQLTFSIVDYVIINTNVRWNKYITDITKRIDKLLIDTAMKNYEPNQVYEGLMWNIYDTLNKTNMIRTKYMNNIKDMEQIDKRICEIINIINICIIHNASEHLLKQNIDTYTKHKEQIQKQKLNKNN
ncbi:hypothetical protein RFI_32064 [Reticulomyxa filosa]|uniref:Uncharacterized protein n=1 Tax=Reticulomyxa filosa TaxID=46433 RepID=X6LW15_RETFI|nr:hypothetical protein RFI_32064 [Reticulomyxa filosa]|eukprot:ETO05332.1 hypothetical protein RFI_32064 [Reticulomyxa filosa]